MPKTSPRHPQDTLHTPCYGHIFFVFLPETPGPHIQCDTELMADDDIL